MSYSPRRLPLFVWLSGLLLSACSGVYDTELDPASEVLGTVEAESCSGASVTSLTILALSTELGEMAGNGGWAVGYPANAIRLEYSIDGTLYSTEERAGSSGTWYFSASPISCGSHTFTVKGSPMVIDSAGTRTTCWSGGKSTSKSVSEPCPNYCGDYSCDWEAGENEWNCPSDCCMGRCNDGSCCSGTSYCLDGSYCMLY